MNLYEIVFSATGRTQKVVDIISSVFGKEKNRIDLSELNSDWSLLSGRLLPNWVNIECSATADIAALHLNPCSVKMSFHSNKESSIALLPYTATNKAFAPLPLMWNTWKINAFCYIPLSLQYTLLGI